MEITIIKMELVAEIQYWIDSAQGFSAVEPHRSTASDHVTGYCGLEKHWT
jgi:hypothetical protein